MGKNKRMDRVSFGIAFREARNRGDGTFKWNGKRYSTLYKEELQRLRQSDQPRHSNGSTVSAKADSLFNDLAKQIRASQEQRAINHQPVGGRREDIILNDANSHSNPFAHRRIVSKEQLQREASTKAFNQQNYSSLNDPNNRDNSAAYAALNKTGLSDIAAETVNSFLPVGEIPNQFTKARDLSHGAIGTSDNRMLTGLLGLLSGLLSGGRGMFGATRGADNFTRKMLPREMLQFLQDYGKTAKGVENTRVLNQVEKLQGLYNRY